MTMPAAATLAATLHRQPLRRGCQPRSRELRPFAELTTPDARRIGRWEEAMAAESCTGPNVARRGLVRSILETLFVVASLQLI